MEINSIQNYYHHTNITNLSRDKRSIEENSVSVADTLGTDTVDISSDGSFKATLNTYSRECLTRNKQSVTQERIEELKAAYEGESCPVSGRDIASALISALWGQPA